MRQDEWGHSGVVPDHVSFGDRRPVRLRRPQRLVQVGDGDLVLTDDQQQLLSLLRQLLQHFASVIRSRRLAPFGWSAGRDGRGRHVRFVAPHFHSLDVGPQSEVHGRPQAAIVGPLGELHPDYQIGPDPSGLRPLRLRGFGEGAGLCLDAGERFRQGRQGSVVEPASDSSRVSEHAVLVVPEDQRTERTCPDTVPFRVACDDEVLLLHGLDLQPRRRPRTVFVGRITTLGQHALEAEASHSTVKGLAIPLDVLYLSDVVGRQHHLRKQPLSLDQRSFPDITAGHVQEIKGIVNELDPPGRLAADEVIGIHGALEQPEVREASLIESDHLAVYDDLIFEDGSQLLYDRRHLRGHVLSVPAKQGDLAVPYEGDDPVPVELRLEYPLVTGKRPVCCSGHHRSRSCRKGRRPTVQPDDLRARDEAKPFGPAPRRHSSALQVNQGEARLGRAVLVHYLSVLVGICIPVFDQKPVLRAACRTHQGPRPSELTASQREGQLPCLYLTADPFLRLLPVSKGHDPTFVRRVDSRVPDYDLTSPVVAIGDHALERTVVYGVVLHLCCQPLLPGVKGGTLRDSPGPEHAIQLQAKVVVEPSRGVLLDDEAEVRGLTPGRRGRGLTRL